MCVYVGWSRNYRDCSSNYALVQITASYCTWHSWETRGKNQYLHLGEVLKHLFFTYVFNCIVDVREVSPWLTRIFAIEVGLVWSDVLCGWTSSRGPHRPLFQFTAAGDDLSQPRPSGHLFPQNKSEIFVTVLDRETAATRNKIIK